MKLQNFRWLAKQPSTRTEDAGGQIVLDFSKYHLSIIDDGDGREKNLYEIGVFAASDGVASDMTSLPGITAEGDTVRGHLTESDVDAIIVKLYTITGTEPTQV